MHPDPDLSSLRLNATTQSVLGQLLRHGEMSVGALASVAEVAPSQASRALRALEERGLVTLREGRSAPAALAPRAVVVLRAEAARLRESAGRRAAEIERLAEAFEQVAPDRVDPLVPYWVVPLSADGPDLETTVRRVSRRVDACVPRGGRPRSVPVRADPAAEVTWRLLVAEPEQAPGWVPPRTRLEVRRTEVDLPFLEVLDCETCCADVIVAGRPRRVWCRQPSQVALVAAGFEHWWGQSSTSAAQPLERATAARQRR
jgi:DNA-binding MarR family transcriptional regulator